MREKITKSILLTILVLLLIQISLYCATLFAYKLNIAALIPFLPVCFLFHIVIATTLYLFRSTFVIEETGEKLDKINIANLLSLIRISTLPTILFLMIESRQAPILPVVLVVTAVAFVTDLLDGRVSRRYHQVTRMGRMLDSTSDYCLLGVITITFFVYQLLPIWLFAVIMFRLCFQAFFMIYRAIKTKNIDPESTLLGKAAIAVTMVLYAAELVRLLLEKQSWDIAFVGFEYFAGIIIFVSIFDKAIVNFRKSSRK